MEHEVGLRLRQDKTLHLVFVTNTLPPYRLPTLKALASEGLFQTEVWTMTKEKQDRRSDSGRPDLSHRAFQDSGLDLSHVEGPVIHVNPKVWRDLRRLHPDMVILGGYDSITCLVAVPLLKLLHIPFIFWIESTLLERTLLRTGLRPLLKFLVAASSGVIVPGSAAHAYAEWLGASSSRIFLVPNSVDQTTFAPPESEEVRAQRRASLGLPSGVLCLFVGRLTEKKGLDELLLAFSELAPMDRELHLVIVGEGRARPRLEGWVRQNSTLAERVHLLGHVEYDRLPAYYQSADIFVFPSRGDVWGFVLNESMSCGLPVVVSDRVGAAMDLVRDGVNGIVFKAGNHSSLTLGIARLASDARLRASYGTAARSAVLKGFTPDISARLMRTAILSARDIEARTSRLIVREEDVAR